MNQQPRLLIKTWGKRAGINKYYYQRVKIIINRTSFRITIVGLDSFEPLLIPSLHFMESCPVPLSFHASLSAGSVDCVYTTHKCSGKDTVTNQYPKSTKKIKAQVRLNTRQIKITEDRSNISINSKFYIWIVSWSN